MIPVSDLAPDQWYISIKCDCDELVILFADLTQGKGSLDGQFLITCPACGKRGPYTAQHYYHQSGLSPAEFS